MSALLFYGSLGICLSLVLPYPASLSVSVKPADENDDIRFEEKEISLAVKPSTMRFMMDNLPTAAMLAEELGITQTTSGKQDGEWVFDDSWIKITIGRDWLKKPAENSRKFSFAYSMGLHELIPLKTTGNATVTAKIAESEDGGVKLDLEFVLETNGSPVDKVARKLRFLLKAAFLMKLEQVMQEAESLGELLEEDAESVTEILYDEDSRFTDGQKEAVKKYLRQNAKP